MDTQTILICIALVIVIVYFLSTSRESLTTSNTLTTCTPEDGVWARDDKLQSPCCKGPLYQVPDTYVTCENYMRSDPSNPATACVARCCKYAQNPSFIPQGTQMAQMSACGCSLFCNNMDVPRFDAWGDPIQYINASKSVDPKQVKNIISGSGM